MNRGVGFRMANTPGRLRSTSALTDDRRRATAQLLSGVEALTHHHMLPEVGSAGRWLTSADYIVSTSPFAPDDAPPCPERGATSGPSEAGSEATTQQHRSQMASLSPG